MCELFDYSTTRLFGLGYIGHDKHEDSDPRKLLFLQLHLHSKSPIFLSTDTMCAVEPPDEPDPAEPEGVAGQLPPAWQPQQVGPAPLPGQAGVQHPATATLRHQSAQHAVVKGLPSDQVSSPVIASHSYLSTGLRSLTAWVPCSLAVCAPAWRWSSGRQSSSRMSGLSKIQEEVGGTREVRMGRHHSHTIEKM